MENDITVTEENIITPPALESQSDIELDMAIESLIFGRKWIDGTPCYSQEVDAALLIVDQLYKCGIYVVIEVCQLYGDYQVRVVVNAYHGKESVAVVPIEPFPENMPREMLGNATPLSRAMARAIVFATLRYCFGSSDV